MAMLDYAPGNPLDDVVAENHYAVIALAGGQSHLVQGFVVSPRVDTAANQSVREFEIWVSDTTSDEAAFTQVLTGTVLNDGTRQYFGLPAPGVNARFVKYVPLTNYGAANNVSTSYFDVVVDGVGGVVGYSGLYSYSYPPEYALDGSTSTSWRTKQGT